MASITKEKSGAYRLKYIDGYKTIGIRLGTRDKNAANSAKAHIEALITTKKLGVSPNAENVAWLNRLDNTIHARIAKAGLTPPRQDQNLPTLKQLIDKFHETFTGKKSTIAVYRNTTQKLLDYYGDRPLEQINEQTADQFHVWLDTTQSLARATISRRIIACRTIWKKAQRWKMTTDNPFSGVKAGPQNNDARKYFVTTQDAEKLIEACPNAQWRLIIALSRFGGLRVPSEVLPLKWSHVNWEERTIRITSPKTEHHDGGGSRIIPLFPELERPLMECFELAQPGEEFVITRYQGTSWQLGEQCKSIARSTGLKTWPKPFHNMRASRASELIRDYELATVSRWLGQSIAVLAKHYAIATNKNADFHRATTQQTNGPESGPVKAQNTAQTPNAPKRTELTTTPQTLDYQGSCHPLSPTDISSHVNPIVQLGHLAPITWTSCSLCRLNHKPTETCLNRPCQRQRMSLFPVPIHRHLPGGGCFGALGARRFCFRGLSFR